MVLVGVVVVLHLVVFHLVMHHAVVMTHHHVMVHHPMTHVVAHHHVMMVRMVIHALLCMVLIHIAVLYRLRKCRSGDGGECNGSHDGGEYFHLMSLLGLPSGTNVLAALPEREPDNCSIDAHLQGFMQA